MQRSAEMLRRTGELANIGGWELDLATMRVDWTEQVFRIHELEPGADAAPRRTRSPSTPPKAGRRSSAAIEAGAREGTPWDLELPFVTAKGNPRWVRAQGVAICEDGRPVRLLGAFQDITEKKTNALELHRLNEQLTRLSTTDALTEVGNRRLFDQTLKIEWQRAARRGEPIGLLMIDVDHFKEYNDHYGHPAGDAVLRQIARMVGESMRRGGELVARYGGEEFALLLPGADLEAARARRRALPRRRVVDAKIEHRASATSAWLGVSIGVASQVATPGPSTAACWSRSPTPRSIAPSAAAGAGSSSDASGAGDRSSPVARTRRPFVGATKASYSRHGKALTAAHVTCRCNDFGACFDSLPTHASTCSQGRIMSMLEGLASTLAEMSFVQLALVFLAVGAYSMAINGAFGAARAAARPARRSSPPSPSRR